MRFFAFFLRVNEGKCYIAQHAFQADQSAFLPRFSARFIYQYGISGCKLHMRKPNWLLVEIQTS